ncbi:MAG: RluA family pseudouridine synthase [Bacteroidales bacterium]|nr:RluA family pseudouridine synthase [Bacteroidales bacterium]
MIRVDDPEWEEEEVQELFEHFRFTIDKGQSPVRIDKYLSAHIEGISRSRIQAAADADYIIVNQKAVKSSYLVKPLDQISIVMPYRRRGLEILPEDIPLDVVYEDGDILVINKPAGLVVHPGHGNYSGTLINAVAWHLGIRGKVEGDERMGVLVHRIDKNTSGLLVLAKTEEAQFRLSKQFFDHSIERQYVALVWGNVAQEGGTIDYAIGRDPNDRLRFKALKKDRHETHVVQGRHAVTHYKVIERFGYVTLISCRLETGRTHQIRVHADAMGHPLFNDDRYGGDRIRKGALYAKFKEFVENCFKIMPRHALHAQSLGFIHPKTKEELHFSAPLPIDFQQVLDRWRRYVQAPPT